METTINVNASENITATTQAAWDKVNATYASNSVHYDKTRNFLEGRKPGYLTDDEFFEVLMNAYSSTYGGTAVSHPGDFYTTVSATLEIVCNTLNSLVDLNFGRELRSVKNS
jgi:hypothetical protein